MSCPFHQLKPGLPPLTPRIAKLPVDERGYPIPFFVAYVNGKPEFRAADGKKFMQCLLQKLCWVCGQRIQSPVVFPIGPMCVLNRITAEPPSHEECAQWSVKGCPFLSKPQMTRRDHEELSKATATAGIMIERNPGVICLWKTRAFHTIRDGDKRLFHIGAPLAVSWWREGRMATRAEVMESVNTGLPILRGHGMDADTEAREMERLYSLLPLT